MRSLLVVLISFFFVLSCGSTKNEGPNYNQMTDVELIQLADKKMEAGHYKESIEDYNRLLQDFPTSNLHIDAQLKKAQAYGLLEEYEKQMDLLYRLVEENIIPDAVPRIEVQIGKFYERAAQFNPKILTSDSTDYRKANKYYQLALKYQDSKDVESRAEAAYRLGMVAIKTGNFDKAQEKFKSTSDAYPKSKFGILSKIKLMNPQDKTELAATDSALAIYRKTLGIEAPAASEKILSDEIITPKTLPAENDSNSAVSKMINNATDESSKQNDSIMDSVPADSLQVK